MFSSSTTHRHAPSCQNGCHHCQTEAQADRVQALAQQRHGEQHAQEGLDELHLAHAHRAAQGQNTLLDQHVRDLGKEFADPTDLQYRARHVVERMALALQASLLVRGAPAFVADAFCASRLAPEGSFNYGALPRGVDVAAIIERATPRIQ